MRKVTMDKTMYAVFSGLNGTHVRPCTITNIEANGFWAKCHNGGDGLEFFENSDVGKSVFFSKDSAQKIIEREQMSQ